MNPSESHKEIPFDRKIIVEVMEQGIRKHHISGLFEVDVTEGRRIIREYEERSGEELSFTSWITKCIAQAVSEHKEVHAIRKGKKLIIFDDVDISVMVERDMDGVVGAQTYIVRNASNKTVGAIHEEIWKIQTRNDDNMSDTVNRKQMRTLLRLPKFLRDFVFWRKFRVDPFFMKEHMGTVNVTALGMFGKGKSGWAVPIGFAPLSFALGGISKKPGVIDDHVEVREFLCVTILLNHDVIDGGPAARFATRFAELVESAFGLSEFRE